MAAVTTAAESGRFEPAVAELVAYLAEEVLPHAVAEEHTVYQAARVRPDLEDMVIGMIDEHRHLTTSVERLAKAESGEDARAQAEAIGSFFAGHVAKENELILPVLDADPNVDLAGLLVQMHRLIEAAQHDSTPGDFNTPDTETTLLNLLLEGANALADAGEADRACRLVATAWTVLRIPRPDLGVRTTAALHRLARSATAEPVSFTTGPRRSAQVHSGDAELDVRRFPHGQRHDVIFTTYGTLAPGAGFVLVNDHDPKPLRYQFEAEHAGEYTWDYLQTGPEWRVRIGRTATA